MGEKCGYDNFLHHLNETNTVVAFTNESSLFMTKCVSLFKCVTLLK